MPLVGFLGEPTPTQLVKVGCTKDLYVRHEPLVGGASHAKGTAEKSLVSLIYGHTHVYQSYTHKKFGPEPTTVTAISNGFLGDIRAKCFDYRGSKDNWQEGFTRIDCDEDTGLYTCQFIFNSKISDILHTNGEINAYINREMSEFDNF